MRRLLILDAGLVVLLVIGGMKLRKDWLAFAPTHDLSAIQPKPLAFPSLPMTIVATVGTSADWTEIPSKDPFSFDRNDIDIPAVVVEAPAKPVGPKPILFATIIIGSDRHAFVAQGVPGNRNSRDMKIGETVDGWTIVDIARNSIEVESNGSRQTVIMNDPSAGVSRDVSRTNVVPATTSSAQPSVPAQPQGQRGGGHYEPTPFGSPRWVADPPKP